MDISGLYQFDTETKAILDTNILIFVFYPYSDSGKVNTYSSILEKLRKAEAQLYLPATVVSEFINRWLRLDFNKNIQNKEYSKDFKKDYRPTERYRRELKQALKQLDKLYKEYNVKQVSDDFESLQISQLTDNQELDFNDLLIKHIAETKSVKILTDDADLKAFKELMLI